MVSQDLIVKLTCDIVRYFSPERIIMFGSRACGTYTSDSDVDLMVVLPFEGKACRKAVEILNRTNPRFPVDILVRTSEQIKARLAMGDFFIREILEKGKVLYETDNTRMGE